MGDTVTLVEGTAFCISGSSGDIVPGTPQGLFVGDSRFLSRCQLRINGASPETLGVSGTDPFSATFVAQAPRRDPRASGSLVVLRSRYVGRGMREDLRVTNFGVEPAYCLAELFLDADFADPLAVKDGRPLDPDGTVTAEARGGTLVLGFQRGGSRRGSIISFTASARLSGRLAGFEVIVPPGESWEMCMQVSPVISERVIEPRYLCGQPVERSTPVERLARWRRQVPAVETDHPGLQAVVARSAEDLGALRLFDPESPGRAVVAAGAPWFMTLFGRDSLITSWQALLLDPELALGVLETLARLQGKTTDPLTDEEPGRILHELRFSDAMGLTFSQASCYYGTADATPLFVMLLGELRRWGLAQSLVDELLPSADRALDWIQRYGDRDGDGYVEYLRASDRGLANQGWKDSWDGIRYADGTVAEAPLALCEVQAYVYAAYLARAYFALEAGDDATALHYRLAAAELKRTFNRDFWLPDKGWYAVALDEHKRPVDSLASNMGHCLWAGIVDEDKAPIVARHLVSDDMFSGWGLRTYARSMPGYHPLSYHCGSVWPHDTAIAAAGLMRYGFVEEATRLIVALLDASASQGHRLPELFSGLDRAEVPAVVAYPTSCSPQAWAAASPLLCLRTLLRLDPWVPHGRVWLAPTLPREIGYLRVDGIPLAGGRVRVEVKDGEVHLDGVPPGLEVILEPRQPGTGL
jgi:glycogen debranching enzyme